MPLSLNAHSSGFFPGFYNNAPLVTTVQTGYITTQVFPVFYKQVVVQFAIPPEWGNCTFNIYRSEGAEGPWHKLNPTPFSSNFFKDTTTQDFSKFMNGWYTVECRLPDGRVIQSPPDTWQVKRHSWVELRATEIQRREMILLSKFTGVQCLYFRRKYFGKRCHNCWNPDIEKTTQDRCPVCLGTSFEGGYFPGFSTFIQFDPVANTTSLDYKGKDEKNTPTAWTLSNPEMGSYDLILRLGDMALFRIEQTQATQLQTKTVRQMLSLIELSKDSVEFALASQAIPSNFLT